MELDLEVAGKLAASTDHLSTELAKGRLYKVSFHQRPTGSAVSQGVTQQVISLGTPPVGMDWNVITLAVTGNDDHTVIAATDVAVYIGDSSAPSLGQLIQPSNAGTIPRFYAYPRESVWVHRGEELFVCVYGVPAATNLLATATVDAYPTDEVEFAYSSPAYAAVKGRNQ